MHRMRNLGTRQFAERKLRVSYGDYGDFVASQQPRGCLRGSPGKKSRPTTKRHFASNTVELTQLTELGELILQTLQPLHCFGVLARAIE